ncbi:WG repeat-containing protein [Conchiformibius steedae]|uniref:WG repeat-containing protein n=1 Tax=Conchiformibius steedae TaxID=153493 RepID=A0A3P2A5I3_9NEIS|nr:WG repeat-containing protein [Conchiformibius steedae]RRD89490.1 WG repeat-containing protein [Conchiformibius steedae]
MSFSLKSMAGLCALLLCGVTHAEPTACERFKQQYAKQYAEIHCVDKDTAVVRNQQDEYAVVDNQNRLLVPFGTYPVIMAYNTFSHNGKLLLNVVAKGKKLGVINRNGKTVVPMQYDDIQMPRQADEPIIVTQDSEDSWRYGLTDQTGKILLEPRYYRINPFSEGLAAYSTDPIIKYGEKNPHARYGYLDTQGKTVIAPQFANAHEFSADVAWAQHPDNGDWLLIDRTGKTLMRLPYAYQNVDNFDTSNLAIAKKNHLFGLINKRGESVLAAEYDWVYWQNKEQFYLLQKDDKFGAANAQGKAVIAPEFDVPTDWDWNKEQTPQGQTAFVRGITVYLFDQNGKQIDQRPARYATQCAHVAIGLPHKSRVGYRVNKVFTDRNYVRFINAEEHWTDGQCSDVAAPHKKGRTHKKRRS